MLIEDMNTNKKKKIEDAFAREFIENAKKMAEEYRLSQPSVEGSLSSNEVHTKRMNQFVIDVINV